MFGPKRKAGEYTFKKIDPPITKEKYDEFVKKLEHLKKVNRPHASKEVMELAHGGDFSENAGYQAAKGRLRGINSKILELEERIKKAKIISPSKNTNTIQLGHTVTVKINEKEHIYKILGSTETDPSKGIISNNSPLGSMLMGRRKGETVRIPLHDTIVDCYIINIET